MNLSAVAALPIRPVASYWYRAIPPGFLNEALGYTHTRAYASRFYEGPSAEEPFEVLYFAQNPHLAQIEAGSLLGSDTTWVANPTSASWLTLNTEVQLTKIADLTDPTAHDRLATTVQELTGSWRYYERLSPPSPAPTQLLGRAIYSSGVFEGFLAISAKVPNWQVLGVFPGRISAGNFIRYKYADAQGKPREFSIPTAPAH